MNIYLVAFGIFKYEYKHKFSETNKILIRLNLNESNILKWVAEDEDGIIKKSMETKEEVEVTLDEVVMVMVLLRT